MANNICSNIYGSYFHYEIEFPASLLLKQKCIWNRWKHKKHVVYACQHLTLMMKKGHSTPYINMLDCYLMHFYKGNNNWITGIFFSLYNIQLIFPLCKLNMTIAFTDICTDELQSLSIFSTSK